MARILVSRGMDVHGSPPSHLCSSVSGEARIYDICGGDGVLRSRGNATSRGGEADTTERVPPVCGGGTEFPATESCVAATYPVKPGTSEIPNGE